MKENSYIEIKNYFENLVLQSNFLEDFVGFFQREWANRESSVKGLKSPYLCLYRYEMGFDGPENNTVAVRKLEFSIMFNNIKPDDIPGQYNAINKAEVLATKILSRIRFDNFKKDHFLYQSFLKDTVEIYPVELDKNAFGVEVSFSLKNKQRLFVLEEDWKDVTDVCP